MVMLKLVAILSVSTLVVAPPPGFNNKYKAQNQNQNQNQNQQGSGSSRGTTSQFGAPVIIPATPLTENPNPLSRNINIALNSDYSISQYSPSESSRDMYLELAGMRYPSGQNSRFSASPVGTPRSARRTDVRFPSVEQENAGVKPGTQKTRQVQWYGYEDHVGYLPPEDRVDIPTTRSMLGMPSNRRGPKLPQKQIMMALNWGGLGRGSDEEDDDDDGLGLDELSGIDTLIQQPGLTPRVSRFTASRGS
ncbi:hypothetical protein TWF281_001036 [Arthrobotrys megalospora]